MSIQTGHLLLRSERDLPERRDFMVGDVPKGHGDLYNVQYHAACTMHFDPFECGCILSVTHFEWLAFLLSSWADMRTEGARAKLQACGIKLPQVFCMREGTPYLRFSLAVDQGKPQI